MSDHINIYIYPYPLTPGDILTDGDDGPAFEIMENTLLIWLDLEVESHFAHPTAYVFITPTETRAEEGEWWPVLNGERILYGEQSMVMSPLKLPR